MTTDISFEAFLNECSDEDMLLVNGKYSEVEASIEASILKEGATVIGKGITLVINTVLKMIRKLFSIFFKFATFITQDRSLESSMKKLEEKLKTVSYDKELEFKVKTLDGADVSDYVNQMYLDGKVIDSIFKLMETDLKRIENYKLDNLRNMERVVSNLSERTFNNDVSIKLVEKLFGKIETINPEAKVTDATITLKKIGEINVPELTGVKFAKNKKKKVEVTITAKDIDDIISKLKDVVSISKIIENKKIDRARVRYINKVSKAMDMLSKDVRGYETKYGKEVVSDFGTTTRFLTRRFRSDMIIVVDVLKMLIFIKKESGIITRAIVSNIK